MNLHLSSVNHFKYFGGCNTEAELKDRLRELALKHHPDRNPDDPDANKKMAEINGEYTMAMKHISSGMGRIYSDGEIKAQWDELMEQLNLSTEDIGFLRVGLSILEILLFKKR